MCSTTKQYEALSRAYQYYNRLLFKGELVQPIITIARKNQTYGYYYHSIFTDGVKRENEIALNPSHLRRPTREVLSTLVHEMTHQWQFAFGKEIPKNGYHNKEWGAKMQLIGLIPSDTGKEGGKRTGIKMGHFEVIGGQFWNHTNNLVESGFVIPYYEDLPQKEKEKKRRHNKKKFTCLSCEQNAWGGESLEIICGLCHIPMTLVTLVEKGESED